MDWVKLKAALLARGNVRVSGKPLEGYIAHSTAGPGAGGVGSVFFSQGGKRVRLSLSQESPVEIVHHGQGRAVLLMDRMAIEGRLEGVALHCPRQAYVTISERCIYRCRYCNVPRLQGRVKSVEELADRIREVQDRIDGIAITSGVAEEVSQEETLTLALIREVQPLCLPIGVSIYPGLETPEHLHNLGVAEVKFNIETATDRLFQVMCPGLDRNLMWKVLDRSVTLFGENHVFSNVIVGLGENDAEMESCMTELCDRGVIPVLRPLLPTAECSSFPRPGAERLLCLCSMEEKILLHSNLDTRKAQTMCVACTGCDLVPGRDA